MDPLFNDYILYYEARMKRWENSDIYIHSYQSEKALYDLIASCNSMEELQSKANEFRSLSVNNAIALVKDQETFRKKVYDDCKEFIRAKGPALILEKINSVQTDMELVETVNRALQQNTVDITIDQLVDFFYTDFTVMENIEVYLEANIPEEWRKDCDGYAQDEIERSKKVWQETQLPEFRKWKEDWTMDYALLHADRHRRLIPVNDEELEKKIALHKKYKTA